MVECLQHVNDMRYFLKHTQGSIGLVPSLGNFHFGHQSLFKRSVVENDTTIVSTVCFPIVFNDYENYLNYPRTPEADLLSVAETGADVLFMPTYEDFFSSSLRYSIVESDFSSTLEGLNRPGHFDGALTVIFKLMQLIQPNALYLGEKDYQQLVLVKGMCEEFFIDTKVVSCPVIRESDGLAYSSRNQQLTPSQRQKAATFPTILKTKGSCVEVRKHLFELKHIKKTPVKLNFLPMSRVEGLEISSNEAARKKYQADIKGCIDTSLGDLDAVIFCTGHKIMASRMMSQLDHYCLSPLKVDYNFSIQTNYPRSTCKLFLNNGAKKSHGSADPNLSLMAWRSACIINALLDEDYFLLSSPSSILDWGLDAEAVNKTASDHVKKEYVYDEY